METSSAQLTTKQALTHAAAVACLASGYRSARQTAHTVTWEADKNDVRDDGEAEIVAHATSVVAVLRNALPS